MGIVRRIVKSKIFITLSLLLGAGILFVIVFNARCSSAQPNFKTVNEQIPAEFKTAENDIKDYSRAEESTYLTFPEWYLVFNPQEYGKFIGENKPSGFPYFSSIGQFWGSYCQVYGITKRNYPFNVGDHLMEVVIGTSFSVEYAVKGVWENTIGRVSEWLGGSQTEEDVYAAKVAQEYGAFIPTDPWYQFPYGKKFIGLWTETHFFGSHFLRKLERKVFLSLEYGVKTGYALLIRIGTHAVYGIADTEIYVSAKNVPDSIFQDPRVRKIKDLGNGSYIMAVPHYQGFTDVMPVLARQSIQFVDFAGNDEILLTAVAPQSWNSDLKNGIVLFTMNMMTSSDKRITVQAPAKSLSMIIVQLESEGVKIEHLYDY
ncbi:MAG: hypothetical protein WCI89_01330 [bacterium]